MHISNIYCKRGKVFFNMEIDGVENEKNLLQAISTNINNVIYIKKKCSAQKERFKKYQKKILHPLICHMEKIATMNLYYH